MTENVFIDRDTNQSYETAKDLVNAYIERFGKGVSAVTGTEVRFEPLDADGFTRVKRGSATVGINVMSQADALIFVARIMKTPATRTEECYRRLLELNYTATSEAAFAVEKSTDTICLRAQRTISGLDYDEFEEMLSTIATVADEWDDPLIREFS
ncbi:MAG: YbjN domain-containing protein [Deltaproteobacteria bacterium]|nr:YbjN domain-containing protein [Deltaproteobacteria bacterium]